jgi:hypothetical protein
MAVSDERVDEVAADEPGTAGDECFHKGGILLVVYFPFDL